MKSIYMAFDFDGTIVSSMNLGIQIYNEIADKHNLRKLQTEEELKALYKLSIPDKMKMFNVPAYKLPIMGIEFKKRYKRHLSTLKFIDGMKEVILKLKEQGYSLGVISSNSVSNIKQFFQEKDMQAFDHVYSSRGLFGKHSTIRNVSKKLKIPREQMIYIGDELRDIDSCKKAGVKIISVPWGFDAPELLEAGEPDYIAREPADILRIMNEINP